MRRDSEQAERKRAMHLAGRQREERRAQRHQSMRVAKRSDMLAWICTMAATVFLLAVVPQATGSAAAGRVGIAYRVPTEDIISVSNHYMGAPMVSRIETERRGAKILYDAFDARDRHLHKGEAWLMVGNKLASVQIFGGSGERYYSSPRLREILQK